MTTPYVRKGRLPACKLDKDQLVNLLGVVTGPGDATARVDITVEYSINIDSKAEPHQKLLSSMEEFVSFLHNNDTINGFVLSLNYFDGSHNILISYINTPTPSGSLYVHGEQAWVDEQFLTLAKYFNQYKNKFTTRLFNGFTGRIIDTVLPYCFTAVSITVAVSIALPSIVRLQYFGILTVACIFATFKLGVTLSDFMIKKLGLKYPYFWFYDR